MTREKEIEKEAYRQEELVNMDAESFVEGAKWADTHPISQWIGVKDGLPEQDEEVIVLCDELNAAPFYQISFAHIVDKTICQDYNGWNIPNVAYWFPIPKLPKE